MKCPTCKEEHGPRGWNEETQECWFCLNPRPYYGNASFWEIPRAARFAEEPAP